MEIFLQEQKIKLVNSKETVTVVLGNESCDLDSAISAIVYSYLIYKVNQQIGVVVPVLNVNRDELALRTEVIFFLEKNGFSTRYFICKDEINLQKLKNENKLRLVLVDHNSLTDEQSSLQESIVQIIDHHKIHDPLLINRCESKVENVGSCCTLIAEEILKSPHLMTEQIALLLFGAILLDTVCLRENAKRVTQKDKDVVDQLKLYLHGINADAIFGELQAAKFDISNLTPAQLLKKDTKYILCESTGVAIASLPLLLEEPFKQEDFYSALLEMSLKRNLAFIIIMGCEMSGDNFSIKRQIAVFDKTQKFLQKVSNFLQTLENPSLDLQPLPTKCDFVVLFEQNNSSLSRKFVLPAIQTYLQSLNTDRCQ